MTCQGGPPFFVWLNIESFGLGDDGETVDDGCLFALLVPSTLLSILLLVLRCFPGLFGFVVFFFLFVAFIMRVFLPCVPPCAMVNDVLDRIVVMGEHREHFMGLLRMLLSVNAHVLV